MNSEKKGLLLITNGFPFGESEQSFLRTEFWALCSQFRVRVLSLGKKEPVLYPFPGDVQAENYAYPSLKTKKAPLRLMRLMNKAVFSELIQAKKNCSAKLSLQRLRNLLITHLNAQAAADDLAKIVEEDHIDVIYTYWCTAMTLAAVLLKKRFPHLRVVTRFHGYDLYQDRSPLGRQPFRPYIADHADKLIFACEAAKRYFLDTWGEAYGDKSVVSYLGCDEKQPISPADDGILRLVSCSNLIPLKRVDLIIEALSLLPESLPFRWHHLGDGPETEMLTAKAHALLDGRKNAEWKFWGFQPNDRLEEIYASIRPDVFVTASSTEGGVPVSIQEAFAMGIPAIGTAVGGIPELIREGQTGFLLPADPSAGEVSAALLRFIRLPAETRQNMGSAAFAVWKTEFDACSNAARFLSLLLSL